MRIRPHFVLNLAVLKFVLIYLLAISVFSTFAFAQDSNFSSDPTDSEKYFILIETQSKTLNVRKDPSAFSPIVGKLLKGSEVPLVDINGDGGTDGNWYRVEIQEGKIGWVSKSYSRKIKRTNQTDAARVLNPGSSDRVLDKKVKNTKPWANIDGFRSAKFGMSEGAVRNAIRKDFSIRGRKIKTINHPTEKTKGLAVTVDKLLPNSGKSRVVYVFGYKSKLLIQVNILTGHPVDTDVTPQQVINSGNLLGNYFFKKRYQKEGLVAHAKLSDGSILIFRGKDQQGRMVLLRVSNPQPDNENAKDLKITLNLSYIEKPGEPDAYKLKDGDF